MFCLPKPHDRFETGVPFVIAFIGLVDAVLLLPLFGSHDAHFLQQYGFIAAHPSTLSFFGALFLHVGIWHYVGNMWLLYVFGRKIEATLGHVEFLVAFLLCGTGGQALYWLTSPHAQIPCVGASGAISGIAGIYLTLYPQDRFDLFLYLGWWRIKTIDSTARIAVAVWIGEQLVLALVTLFLPVFNTAFWAHVGGFATGAAVAALYRKAVPPPERPCFSTIEVPLTAEIAQPNPLIGLGLSRVHQSPSRSTSSAT